MKKNRHLSSIFDWCVVRWGSKNKHHTYTCLKDMRLCVQMFIDYSTLNTKHNKEDLLYSIRESTTHTLQIIRTKSMRSNFPSSFCWKFHHRLANATQLWRYKYDQQKMENKKTNPNNTHIRTTLLMIDCDDQVITTTTTTVHDTQAWTNNSTWVVCGHARIQKRNTHQNTRSKEIGHYAQNLLTILDINKIQSTWLENHTRSPFIEEKTNLV